MRPGSLPPKPRPLNRENLRSYFHFTSRGLALAWRASPRLGTGIALLTAVSATLPPALAYVGKLIIDAVVARDSGRTLRLVAVELGLVAAITATQRGLFLARTILGNRLGVDVNTMILRKAVSLDLAQIENSEFYDKLNRARQEASSRSLQLVTDTLQFLQNAFTLLGYLALLLTFSGWVVAALLVASLPAAFAEMRFSSVGFRLYNWRSADRRRLAYMEYVLATDAHAKEVRVFGLGIPFLARYQALAEKFFTEDTALATRRTIWVILLSLLSSATFYACYAFIALAAAAGRLTLGNLTLYVAAFRQGQQAFQSCLTAIGGTYEHNLYLSNLFDFLAIPAARIESARSGESAGPPSNLPPTGIFFDRVSFRYPGRDTWALQNITLHIPSGQSVAIVGANGAGKSTLIKLLCRLYQPTEGAIYLDGKNLRAWEFEDLLGRLSVVFQDFNRYQLNLRENVGVGNIDTWEDEQSIRRAMDRGGAADLLREMSLESALGSWFQEGRELSGGQWQKIAVSRAFLRENADILILDEPTAALDAEAESRAFQQFRELTRGKTSLIISHRFPVARLADHILVIEHGQIQEAGSHEELTALGGRYAQLFTLQAKGYA